MGNVRDWDDEDFEIVLVYGVFSECVRLWRGSVVFRCPLLTIPYKKYSDTSYFKHKLLNFEEELHYQNLIKIQAKTPRFIAGILEFHFLKDELH